MKIRILPIVSCLLLFFLSGIVQADLPQILPGFKIKDGQADLKVNLYAAPTAADWNNDGRKDLVIGQEINGHISLFLNQGSDLNPLFDGGSLIESSGVPITTSYS